MLIKRKTLALATLLLAMIVAVGAYSAAVAPKTSTQEVSEGLRCPTQFEDPLPEVEVLRRMDVTLLGIDHSVSVQEERFTLAHTHEKKRENPSCARNEGTPN